MTTPASPCGFQGYFICKRRPFIRNHLEDFAPLTVIAMLGLWAISFLRILANTIPRYLQMATSDILDSGHVCEIVLTRLKRYGISGVLAYGLLNTAYYLTTFLLVWFYVAPAPGKLGFLAAAERALAVAPFVDDGLSWFTIKFKFDSQGKAFMAIVSFCFGLAIILFLAVTLLLA